MNARHGGDGSKYEIQASYFLIHLEKLIPMHHELLTDEMTSCRPKAMERHNSRRNERLKVVFYFHSWNLISPLPSPILLKEKIILEMPIQSFLQLLKQWADVQPDKVG